MGVEIERKFLVDTELWQAPTAGGQRLRQGYLARGGGCTVRVRAGEEEAWLTLKGPTSGISRAEFEYPIPLADASELLETFCADAVVEKTRHNVMVEGAHFQVDVFAGSNAGLVVAEIELETPTQPFPRPDWLGLEVSEDPRYRNSRLAQMPWRNWTNT